MRKLFLFCAIWCISLLSAPLTSGFSGDIDTIPEDKTSSSWSIVEVEKTETIKELRENINELESEKKKLKLDWQNFLSENGKLQDFLKDDIPEEDEARLREIIDLYTIYKQRVDSELQVSDDQSETEALKKELLRLKQDLYKKLVYFIKVENLDDFLTYVKWDLSVNEKRKDVDEEIDEDTKKLEEKVQVIRDKIQENKKVLDERIRMVIEKKLDEKISKILADKRFAQLDNDSKKQLFIITLEKLRTKKEGLTSLTEKTSLIDKKIETFNIIEQKLIEVMNWFETESEQ